MGRLLMLGAIVAVFASLAMAETWTGRLIDSNCYDQQQDQKNVGACIPTNATSSFALYVEGKVFKLDEGGNTKAAAAIKDRADRSTDPDKLNTTMEVTAKVTGSMDADNKLKVETIQVQ
jgi:hypothetical protein